MLATLSTLSRDFTDSTDALIRRFDIPVPSVAPYDSTCPMAHEDGQALLVVRLQNSWADFCRNLIRTSMANETRFRKAARSVAKEMGDRYPVWHKPEFIVRLARHAALTNQEGINLHLGANLSASHVTNVRNYIIHPGSHTEAKYREVAAAQGVPGADVRTLLNVRAVGGASLFERWVRDLQRTASNSIA